jgi:hypothetical protein
MEARISITTAEGKVYEGTVILSSAGPSKKKDLGTSSGKARQRVVQKAIELQFTVPVRPFMKKYGTGMSGSKRLVLLAAHMAGGNVGTSVEIGEVQRLWGKMSVLMGGAYNPAHVSRARDNGWIDSPKFGTLALLNDWKQIL